MATTATKEGEITSTRASEAAGEGLKVIQRASEASETEKISETGIKSEGFSEAAEMDSEAPV